MAEKKRFKAVINNKTYTIVGTEEKSQLEMVTQLINEQLTEVKNLSSTLTTEDAAILVAVNAVNDQLKKQTQILMQQKEMAELKRANAQMRILENKVRQMELVEEKARNGLKEAGIDQEITNPIQAQQVLNELQKQKIQHKAGTTD
ncbi:cell division protein ZapA [Enterococcus timonensis]|uniref:cell division protein ZapA n=1 Tax=Enterococcus timonensis TaxID=1852364 RepID=UPI0008DB18CC|nr:cell division protein ZapA [Enterococcus timonensis]